MAYQNLITLFIFTFYFANIRSREINDKIPELFQEVFEGRGYDTNDASKIINLLTEIKSLLTKTSDVQKTEKRISQLENAAETSKLSIHNLENNFRDLSNGTTQKVNIFLQAFSTLKLVVEGQIRQFPTVLERLSAIENNINNVEEKCETHRMVTDAKLSRNIPAKDSFLQSNALTASIPDAPQIFRLDKHGEIANLRSMSEDNTEHISKSIDKTLALSIYLNNSLDQLNQELNSLRKNISSHGALLNELQKNKSSQTQHANTTRHNTECTCEADKKIESVLSLIERESEGTKVDRQSILDQAEFLKRIQDKMHLMEDGKKDLTNQIREMIPKTKEISSIKSHLTTLYSDVVELKEEIRSVENSVEDITSVFTRAGVDADGTSGSHSISIVPRTLCVWPYARVADSCFHVVRDKRKSWEDARKHCKDLQGDLAAPENFLVFKKYIAGLRLSRSYSLWVGASDLDEEGMWRWVDEKAVNKTVWMAGQPDGRMRENCMELQPKVGFIASDTDCRTQKYFVCEMQK